MNAIAKAPSGIKPIGRTALAFLAVLGLALLAPAKSPAAVGYPFVSAHGPDGTSGTHFVRTGPVAVDQATHDVYVLDPTKTKGKSVLYRFTSSGAPHAFTAGPGAGTNKIVDLTLPKSSYYQIAVAPPGAAGGTAGNVYVPTDAGVLMLAPNGASLGILDGSGNPHPHPGSPSLSGVATDTAGNLYVSYAGGGSGHVAKYVPSANPVTPGDFDSEIIGFPQTGPDVDAPCGLAVSANFLYTLRCSGHWLRKYPLAGLFPGGGGSADVTGKDSVMLFEDEHARSITVDQSSGDLFVGIARQTRSVQQFDETGATLGSIDLPLNTNGGGVEGVGFDETSGKLFLGVDTPQEPLTNQLRIYGPAVTIDPPTATIDPVADFDFDSAELSGTVSSGKAGEFQATTYRFECKPSCSGLQGERSVSADGAAHAVSDKASGLKPETTYEVTLIAKNAAGEVKDTVSFETEAKPPVNPPLVTIDPLGTLTPTTVDVSGTVDPGGTDPLQASTYRFEYTPESSYFSQDEVQQLTVRATAGSFVLSFEKEETPPLPFDATAAEVQAALNALDAIEDVGGSVAVSGGPGDATGTAAYEIAFGGSLADKNVSTISVDAEGLSGGLPNGAAIDTTTQGRAFFDGATRVPDPAGNIAPGSSPVPVARTIEGLQPNTAYRVRLVAVNVGGEAASPTPDQSFTTPAASPLVQTLPASQVGPDSARINGQVNPRNSPTAYYFQWGTADCALNPCVSIPVSQDAAAGSGATFLDVNRPLAGLSPETTYHYRLVAQSPGGTTEGADLTFITTAVPAGCANSGQLGTDFLPDCRAWEMVSPPNKNGGDVAADTGRDRAAIGGDAFQFTSLTGFADVAGYGVAADYIAKRTEAAGTNGWSTHAISPAQDPIVIQGISNTLDPLYEGELSADLSHGAFRSYSPVSTASDPHDSVRRVPNLYLRTDLLTPGAGSYSLLSECPLCEETDTPLPRSFDKPFFAGANGGDATHEPFTHVIYEYKSVQRLTADSPGPGLLVKLYEGLLAGTQEVQTLAVNATGGTFTLGYGPETTDPIAYNAPAAMVEAQLEALSSLDDVSVGGGPGGAAGTTPYAIAFGGSLHETNVPQLSADASGLSGGSASAQIGTRLGGGQHVRLVGRVPSGGASVCDDRGLPACIGAQSFAGTDAGASGGYVLHAISDDGSKVFFRGAEDGNVYLREDGARTIQLDASEASTPGSAGDSEYWTAAADGSRVFFTTGEKLVDGAANGTNLYMYDTTKPPGAQNLTLVSKGSGGSGGVGFVLGASEDGHYAYFTSSSQLIAGEPTGFGPKLYRWHDGALDYIGAFPIGGGSVNSPRRVYTLGGSNRYQARVSPDGRHLLFAADGSDGLAGQGGFEGYDHGFCGEVGGCQQLFVYSSDSGTLQCASCNPGGAALSSNGDAEHQTRESVGGSNTSNHVNRALSANGRYAFFDTGERLVPEDVNGVRDVYRFDTQTGTQRLISSGEDKAPSYFLDASENGRDAFFLTREKLSRWDVDTSYDVYDARMDGGLPEPPPVPPACIGDACQPNPLTLNDPTPSSASFEGLGNPKSESNGRCPKGKHRVKARGGKSRCVRKKKARCSKAKAKRHSSARNSKKARCAKRKRDRGHEQRRANGNGRAGR